MFYGRSILRKRCFNPMVKPCLGLGQQAPRVLRFVLRRLQREHNYRVGAPFTKARIETSARTARDLDPAIPANLRWSRGIRTCQLLWRAPSSFATSHTHAHNEKLALISDFPPHPSG